MREEAEWWVGLGKSRVAVAVASSQTNISTSSTLPSLMFLKPQQSKLKEAQKHTADPALQPWVEK